MNPGKTRFILFFCFHLRGLLAWHVVCVALLSTPSCAAKPATLPAGAPEAPRQGRELPEVQNAVAAPSRPAAGTEVRPEPARPSATAKSADMSIASGAARVSHQPAAPIRPHPLAQLSQQALQQRAIEDLPSLGSISVGRPNSGRLLNAARMPDGPGWEVLAPHAAWGTEETIHFISVAISEVRRRVPNTPPAFIGDISARQGGRLRPHKSHQAGRDVDLGYYYRGGGHWYQLATAKTLDKARTWALVRALVELTDVRFILMAYPVQKLLKDYALGIGEDPAWVADLFKGSPGQRSPLIRYAPGHQTHMHVRFYNPIAQRSARLCYPALIAAGIIKPPTHTIQYRARKGDSLIRVAKRFGTTVRAIQRANRMGRRTRIYARKSYTIPRKGPAPGLKLQIPQRRLSPRPWPDFSRQVSVRPLLGGQSR